LLLAVAALLSTSATLGIVVEASSVSESQQIVVSAPYDAIDRSAWFRALDGAGRAVFALPAPELSSPLSAPLSSPEQGVPGPFIGPRPDGSGSTQLRELKGTALLDGLAQLTRAELRDFAQENPDAVAGLVADPPAARDIAAWWGGTSPRARANLSSTIPGALGQLEGLPYRVRDSANRTTLAQTEHSIRSRMSGSIGRAERDELTTRLHMLEQVAATLAAGTPDAPRTLVSIDVTGEGRAVVAVGDLATADYVSYLVPGMFMDVDAQISAWADTATNLRAEQDGWLERLQPDSDATVATVAWIGYQTPTLVNVASMELAREGRDALTASLTGLRAARGDDQPYLSILAHSYGSTAALLALEENDVSVDALAMVGSPGSPARSVDELHVTAGNVWVGGAEWDPIPASGAFGSQPMSEEYGAHHFGVSGATDPLTHEQLSAALAHNDYFVEGGESFRNLALIGIGQGRFVLGNDGVAAGRMLARSVAHRIL
jgi:hypothetical protein